MCRDLSVGWLYPDKQIVNNELVPVPILDVENKTIAGIRIERLEEPIPESLSDAILKEWINWCFISHLSRIQLKKRNRVSSIRDQNQDIARLLFLVFDLLFF